MWYTWTGDKRNEIPHIGRNHEKVDHLPTENGHKIEPFFLLLLVVSIWTINCCPVWFNFADKFQVKYVFKGC